MQHWLCVYDARKATEPYTAAHVSSTLQYANYMLINATLALCI